MQGSRGGPSLYRFFGGWGCPEDHTSSPFGLEPRRPLPIRGRHWRDWPDHLLHHLADREEQGPRTSAAQLRADETSARMTPSPRTIACDAIGALSGCLAWRRRPVRRAVHQLYSAISRAPPSTRAARFAQSARTSAAAPPAGGSRRPPPRCRARSPARPSAGRFPRTRNT